MAGRTSPAKKPKDSYNSMRFKRVIVINPPSPPGYVANRESHGGYGQLYPVGTTNFPPLDVPYLAGYLHEKQIPLEVLDGQGHSLGPEELATRVQMLANENRSEKILVIVRVALCCLDWDLSVCSKIKGTCGDISLAIWGPVLSKVLNRVRYEASLDFVIHNE